MPTLVWDYLNEFRDERADILDAVETVFSSSKLVLGDNVSSFESEFAAYHTSTTSTLYAAHDARRSWKRCGPTTSG